MKQFLRLSHPFIAEMHHIFDTENRLHLVMDFARAGDLRKYLKAKKVFKESVSKFYAA
jgi:serine/threonine protein kinase